MSRTHQVTNQKFLGWSFPLSPTIRNVKSRIRKQWFFFFLVRSGTSKKKNQGLLCIKEPRKICDERALWSLALQFFWRDQHGKSFSIKGDVIKRNKRTFRLSCLSTKDSDNIESYLSVINFGQCFEIATPKRIKACTCQWFFAKVL